MLKAKLRLLEALADIQVALKSFSTVEDEGLHSVDRNCRQLDVNISALEMKSNQWKMVQHSNQSTNATAHGMYSMEVLDVFCLDNEDQ